MAVDKDEQQKNKGPEHNKGYQKIAQWPEYEAFRSAALLYLGLLNVLLIAANILLYFKVSFAPLLAVVAIVFGIMGIYQAIQFTERIKDHFRAQPTVQKTIEHAAQDATEPAHWLPFLKTIDGQLVAFAVILFIVMAEQFWQTLH
ncbi:MAG: hypothetical protein V1838_00070 [Patescibacteria group bacterium]